jgi:hypothetical protein
MFYVGQKVVCIREDWRGGYGDEELPRKGRVYTIRGIDLIRGTCSDQVGLWLEEIVNEPRIYEGGLCDEVSFGHQKFRPLVVRRTDISLFQKMLTPKKENAYL